MLETSIAGDPLDQFRIWFDDAVSAKVKEPNAMTLATADAWGRPSARIVLLKGLDQRGLTWFTNYQSRKGQELATNQNAAIVFFWAELERQVRVEGIVEMTTPSESNEYFNSRPIGSRIGAWASPQSQVIPNREVLEENEQRLREEMGDAPTRPEHWGGYRLTPRMFEFWQGRTSRLHDRLRYSRQVNVNDTQWKLERLAP